LGDVTSAAPLQFLILLVASWLRRHQGEAIDYLRAENRVLRRRLGPKRLRFTDAERRLLAERGKPLGRKRLADVASLATPETILRWYREKVAAKYDGSRTRGWPGRPRSRGDTVKQLVTMARDNPSWGYTRLRGALKNLGLDIGRSTIQRILRELGIEPAPVRGKTMPWKTFLKSHWGAIAAADFFSVEVLTVGGLLRYLVLFVIDLKTRRVHIAGIAHTPDGACMAQIARNLTDAVTGPLRGFDHLIVDRDPLYTERFKQLLATANVCLLRLPANSPNLNAYAQRFVRSIKQECLRHIVPLGEGHLRKVVGEFVEHYHAERNHQGLANVIPFPSPASPAARGRIGRHERLGGLLKFYQRSAA
jgi:putative transposase